ncbi:hypothetical protein RchiOBHm_Chr4g0419441 [Rosa chinensis]|uniref:Secreted protein n=1 Tax=Rosa chinensis TaxID=74649 RepID=A0A2P6QXK6_ROSCH|nr:hypothetical protein RchiOBHm_Chr4g0419441 [Rosa chinensis]
MAVLLKLLVHTLVSLSIRIRIHHSNTTHHHRHHNRSPKILNFTLRLVVWSIPPTPFPQSILI